jgi:hypothetical protein
MFFRDTSPSRSSEFTAYLDHQAGEVHTVNRGEVLLIGGLRESWCTVARYLRTPRTASTCDSHLYVRTANIAHTFLQFYVCRLLESWPPGISTKEHVSC